MVMNPFIFIVTYGLFFTYNIFYFLIIDNNSTKSNTILNIQNNSIPNIQNNTILNQIEQINIKNNELEQINNNFIKKYNQNKNHNYNFFEKEQNCYISDIIIHYKCD